jgi:hypothetical protein
MPFAPLHHTLIAMDVEKSGKRDDPLLLRMRADLRMIIGELLVRQHLDPHAITVEDLGDGYRLLFPAAVTPMAALDPFIPNLATALRLHRQASSAANRLRLRVAVHTGLLHGEPGGTWTGTPLRELARLLDADAARRVLQDNPEADLVLAVSQLVHDTVVRHGYTLDPAGFRAVRLQAKETDETVWVHIPGTVPPPEPPASRVTEDARLPGEPGASAQWGMFGNHNTGTFHFGDVYHSGGARNE